jgi:hypothetical protein
MQDLHFGDRFFGLLRKANWIPIDHTSLDRQITQVV